MLCIYSVVVRSVISNVCAWMPVQMVRAWKLNAVQFPSQAAWWSFLQSMTISMPSYQCEPNSGQLPATFTLSMGDANLIELFKESVSCHNLLKKDLLLQWWPSVDLETKVFDTAFILLRVSTEVEGILCLWYRPFGYERVYLPLCKVTDTPFHI